MSNASAITGSASVAGGTASGVPLSNEYPVDVLSGQRNPRGIPQMLFFDEAPPTVAPQLSSGDGASSAGGGLVGWLFNSVVMPLAFPLVRHNLVPDFLLRLGVRMVCREVLRRQEARPLQQQVADKAAYVADLRSRGVLAVATADANKQHYEVPAAFFELVMGKHKKYSCGIWPELDAAAAGLARPAAATTLDESEALALALVCERAKIEDVAGTRVLDMGCGWGSFTLFAAARFPRVAFTALSNSASQKRFIDAQAAARGLANVTVVTCDINEFEGSGGGFDRVVSIEMMEHVKNYDLLLRRVASWMRPGALMFVHIFTHRLHPFHYEKGWMAENVSSSCRSPHPARTPHPTPAHQSQTSRNALAHDRASPHCNTDTVLCRRTNAERRPPPLLPARPAHCRPLGRAGHALRAHEQRVARVHGQEQGARHARACRHLRQGQRGALVCQLAPLLHCLRRALWPKQRQRVRCLALPLPAARVRVSLHGH